MKHHTVFLIVLLACGTLGAAIFGGEPYEVFNASGTGYVVMGHSLIDDQMTLYGEGLNRQGDTCLENSGAYTMDERFPVYAEITKAYLIWTGAVDPKKMDQPTDNTVTLRFKRGDGYSYEDEIVAGDAPKMLGDTSDPFLFESVKFTADVMTGCSETEPGTAVAADLAYFTYRTEVTDFFKRIQEDNEQADPSLTSGQALRGDYSVGGLDCTQDDLYRCPTLMVSNWALILVYRAVQEGSSFNVYLYPGFSFKKDETAEVTLSGLDRPYNAFMQIVMLAAEGDPALLSADDRFELVTMRGKELDTAVPITGDCDPQDTVSNEIWDSRSSAFEYVTSSDMFCTSYDREYTFGLDIDYWYLDTAWIDDLAALLPIGSTEVDLSFRFAADEILTNFLILSEVQMTPYFGIPDEDELRNCLCYPEETREVFCAGEPQYFFLAVENWGEAQAESVYAQVEYDRGVFDYVPGTTEIATKFDGSGNGTNWEKIIDGPEGEFPLREPNLIANILYSFIGTPEKAASYLIRFQLLPRTGLAKNVVGTVSATINDVRDSYEANDNLPLKLFPGDCLKSCTEKELRERCGGLSSDLAQIFDPKEDETAGPDEQPDEMPDIIIDPRSTHPMTAQTPGCSLTVL